MPTPSMLCTKTGSSKSFNMSFSEYIEPKPPIVDKTLPLKVSCILFLERAITSSAFAISTPASLYVIFFFIVEAFPLRSFSKHFLLKIFQC